MVARRFYDSAVTMCMGSVDEADLWMLPRIPLYPTNSVTAARLKVLLHCSAFASTTIRARSGRAGPDHREPHREHQVNHEDLHCHSMPQ